MAAGNIALMGGKNMTFYQRVTARPLGACVAEAE
jgi:hypothetical protein